MPGTGHWKGVAPRRAAKAATAEGRKREAPETGSPETKEKRVIPEGRRRDTKELSIRDSRRPSSQFVCADSSLKGNCDESGPPRERGRPARILCLGLPRSFPAMAHPSTLPVGTAWARPKQSPGVFAGRSGSRRWARLCQCCAGGTPALPGGLPPMTPSNQRRSILLRVYSCSFVVCLHLVILSILCIHVQ